MSSSSGCNTLIYVHVSGIYTLTYATFLLSLKYLKEMNSLS